MKYTNIIIKYIMLDYQNRIDDFRKKISNNDIQIILIEIENSSICYLCDDVSSCIKIKFIDNEKDYKTCEKCIKNINNYLWKSLNDYIDYMKYLIKEKNLYLTHTNI